MKSQVQTMLEKSVVENFHRNALWIKGNYYTYKQLAQKANAIIAGIVSSGQKINRIAIITHDEPETYASIIAALLMGIGFVPISPSFPPQRKKAVLEMSDVDIVLTSGKSDKEFIEGVNVNVFITSNLKLCNSDIKVNDISGFSDIACILFTSGSTGIPKGVPLTYKNIETTLDSYFSLGYGPFTGDRCLQMFEFTFDMSLISYLPALLSGACIYSMVDDKMRFFSAFKIMKDFQLTFAVFVPSTLAFMRKYFSTIQFPSLQCCLVGGEPFTVDLAREWAECAPNTRIINISGPTETTMACMGYEVNRKFDKNKNLSNILAFGKPWKNTKAIVVNEQLDIVPPGERGELCFAGEHLMNGYLNNPERNKEVFFTKVLNERNLKFYRTGDGAFVDEEGDFYTCGRIDLQVKIQGYRVEPGEIEAVARQIAGNVILVAIPYKKHDGFWAIRLYVEGISHAEERIKPYLLEKLPPYMVPDEITYLNPMPLNTNGKIDRNYLQRILEEENG
jgi:D-alanine--poly(phosphoribitol) ligase subunit 1